MSTYRRGESLPDTFTPHHLGMSQPLPEMEPWMDDMLDESYMAAPLDFDSLNNQFLNPLAFDADTLAGSFMDASNPAFNGVHDLAYPASLQSESLELPDAPPASYTLSQNPSTCSTFSPQTPLLDLCASFDSSSSMPSPVIAGDASQVVFDQVAAAFKDLARARAEADPRPVTQKEKRRDASLALYLQRLRDTCNEAVAMLATQAPTGDNVVVQTAAEELFHDLPSFDDIFVAEQPQSSSSAEASISPLSEPPISPGDMSIEALSARCSRPPATPPPGPSSKRQRTAAGPVAGGVELVMDLNMNAATTLPRKHRPRTQAQRERYLAVRNQGACEKHKRQHKRCTCIDNAVETKSAFQNTSQDHVVKRSRADRASPGAALSYSPQSQGAQTQPLPAGRNHHSPRGFCPGGCEEGCWYCQQRSDERWPDKQQRRGFVVNEPGPRAPISNTRGRVVGLRNPTLSHGAHHLDPEPIQRRSAQNTVVDIARRTDEGNSPSRPPAHLSLVRVGSPGHTPHDGGTHGISRDLTRHAYSLLTREIEPSSQGHGLRRQRRVQSSDMPLAAVHRLQAESPPGSLQSVQSSRTHSPEAQLQSALQGRPRPPTVSSGSLPTDRLSTPSDIPYMAAHSGRHKPSLAMIQATDRRLAALLPPSPPATRSSSPSPAATPPPTTALRSVSYRPNAPLFNLSAIQNLVSCVLHVVLPSNFRSCGREWESSPMFWLATWGLVLWISVAMR